MVRKKSPGELRTQMIRVDKSDAVILKAVSISRGVSIAYVVHLIVCGELVLVKEESYSGKKNIYP